MQTIYQSHSFTASDIAKVYIAFDAYGKNLKQFDVNSQGYTIRESVVEACNFSKEHIELAYRLKDKAFKQVQVK